MKIALIVAGGKGTRMGGDLPKQFLMLSGKPVLIRTIEAFLNHKEIDGVIVGMNGDWLEYGEQMLQRYFSPGDRVFITTGGASRQETLDLLVQKAVKLYQLTEEDFLVTHDAVRPFVSERLISESIEAAKEYGVSGTYISASDTIVVSADGHSVSEMPSRTRMYQAQTPQTFRLGTYQEVWDSLTQKELEEVTDACKLFYLRGIPVKMVQGDVQNIKITHPMDYRIAKMMVKDFGGTNGTDVEC